MTARRQWAVIGGIVAVAAIALTVATRVLSDELVPIEAGTNAPDFHAVPVPLDTVPGTPEPAPKSLRDYRGQVVLLNLWATWCAPCRAEMPSLQKLHEDLGTKGLRIVAVSVDLPGMAPAIRDFARELGLHFELLHDAQGNIRNDYQSTGVPETFIIDRAGVIRKRVIMAADWNAEEQKVLLRQLLAEPAQ